MGIAGRVMTSGIPGPQPSDYKYSEGNPELEREFRAYAAAFLERTLSAKVSGENTPINPHIPTHMTPADITAAIHSARGRSNVKTPGALYPNNVNYTRPLAGCEFRLTQSDMDKSSL